MKIKLEKKLFEMYSEYLRERKDDKALALREAILERGDLGAAYAECEKAQSRCRERIIVGKINLLDYLAKVKRHLDEIPAFKKDLDGTKIYYSPFACHDKPRSYRYEMQGTVLKIEYIKGNLYLTDICRMNCEGDTIRVLLSDNAKETIINKIRYDQLFNER